MLEKQSVTVNFLKGVNTKTDPYQLPIGNFLALRNSVFTTEGQLTKRNGYPLLTNLPNALQTTLTTYNNNLTATGSNLYAYSSNTRSWINKGSVQPIDLEVQSLVRNSTSQVSPDSAVSESGLVCLAYMDTGASYYQISDSSTGQQIINRVALPSTAVNPRVFLLNRYFIITFLATVAAAPHMQYIAIPVTMPGNPGTATDITTDVLTLQAAYDGVVANNSLFLSWATATGTIKTTYLSSTLILTSPVFIPAVTATLMSVTADTSGSTPIIWVTFYDSGTQDGFTAAYNQILGVVLASTQIINNLVINEITAVATSSLLTVIYENANTYGFSPNAKTDFLSKLTVTQAGAVSSITVILRSVGLASKAFIKSDTGVIYVLATYGETNQPTYFLIDSIGNIYMRLAYANGGGYAASQVLPSVSLLNSVYMVPYLIKDFLATVNKGTDLPAGTPVNSIYTQTGINLAQFTINNDGQQTSEIANCLSLTGGQVWQYDAVKPVEHGFQVWPENIVVTTATGAGSITAQTYYYSFTYEWTDNAGNLHRSAPSIPVPIVTTTASSTNTIKVPTLRLTYKISPNPVRIVGYRWSQAQQTYYQFTSITSPVINSTTTDNVTIVDAVADSSILGQTLLYTTGGVVENIAPPPSSDITLFKNRVFLIDSEDKNLLWYSKPVIENTPVEFSDLFTAYIAPTTGAQGSTGKSTAIAPMDDKLIIFKSNSIYYMTGNGPDITGANNDFIDPVFVTSAVGTTNKKSIVLTPNGLMFQSDKGIWLLGRDLSTTYIGAPVEGFNSSLVKSAQSIPGTTEVRFILDSGITLMYDYFYQQWGTFSNLSAISATLFNNLHTYLNTFGEVYQESPGTYLDGTSPVLLSFTTSWINVAGIQGYERFYFGYLLGTYYTPFKLNVEIAYDYNQGPEQSIIVTPDNYTPNYGDDPVYGSGEIYGGPGNVLEARFFPEKQKCESFQLTITESYDPSYNIPAGQGLTMSGLNLVVGMKKGYRIQKASRSFG